MRFTFRFCIVYFTLYSLATQIIGGVILTPWFSFPALCNIAFREFDQRLVPVGSYGSFPR